MKENFPNVAKEIDFQEVQEAQRVPKKLDPRRNTSRYIIITLPKIKDKEGIFKASGEKETVTYKGVLIRLSADFSEETLQVRRDWQEVFTVMKGKDLHPRLLYPVKLSFRCWYIWRCPRGLSSFFFNFFFFLLTVLMECFFLPYFPNH